MMAYQTCYKVVLTSLIQSWYNKNVTRLATQGCNNIVISRLYRTCWNNLATSLIISTRLFKLLTACSKLVDNLGQAVRTQLVDGLLANLLQDVRFLAHNMDAQISSLFALAFPVHPPRLSISEYKNVLKKFSCRTCSHSNLSDFDINKCSFI
jgi:hypothetical protein